jgi:hypothetical protein
MKSTHRRSAVRSTGTVAVWLALCAGCTSARQAAQPAVRLTADGLHKYQAGLQTRIDAEDALYKSLAQDVTTSELRDLYLNRLAQESMALNRFADSILVDKKGVPEAGLADFLAAYDDEFDASLVHAAEVQVKAKVQEQTSFAKLSFDESALSSVDQKLAAAARQRSHAEELQYYATFATNVNKKFEALKQLDALRAKAATTQATTKPTTKPG